MPSNFSLIKKTLFVLLGSFLLIFVLSCRNDNDDDKNENLNSTYAFSHSCSRPANKICVNYYPEDGIRSSCLAGDTQSSSKCTATNSIASCSLLPRTRETVYYNDYTYNSIPNAATAAQQHCTAQVQSRFSSTYSP